MRTSELTKSVSREEMVRLVEKYLGRAFEPLSGSVYVRDVDETGIKGRLSSAVGSIENCWVVYLPNRDPENILGPSRILCIDKRTGEVIYDGSEGGKK